VQQVPRGEGIDTRGVELDEQEHEHPSVATSMSEAVSDVSPAEGDAHDCAGTGGMDVMLNLSFCIMDGLP
jgi:hypothetical protein